MKSLCKHVKYSRNCFGSNWEFNGDFESYKLFTVLSTFFKKGLTGSDTFNTVKARNRETVVEVFAQTVATRRKESYE